MIFAGEDGKVSITNFRGLYSRRGDPDEVPPDHAQDCQNVTFPADSGFTTVPGVSKALLTPQWVKRFFLLAQTPADVNQPPSYVVNPGYTDGGGLLWCDSAGRLYVGNGATPIYSPTGANDFVAINMGNRTYISPFTNSQGAQYNKLLVFDPTANTIRPAAGLAPVQDPGVVTPLAASQDSTAGNCALGVHLICVIYETDTGYWTQPGPKYVNYATPTPSSDPTQPTIFTTTGSHGMTSGESHTFTNCTGQWAICNDTWLITRIDDTHFSIPVNTFGFVGATAFQFYGAFTEASVTSDGSHSIKVTNIPTGPSYVRKRIILATRANETEFFFVPNVPVDANAVPPITAGSYSVLNDNTTTSTYINFNDTDLVDSADYLFDLAEVIQAGTALCKYRGRLAIAGVYLPGEQERILVSNIDDQETFSNVSGYIQVQTERDGNVVTGLFVLRDTFYMTKFTGTFGTEDNGNDPSTWPVTVVDAIVGSYGFGIAEFTASQPASADTGDIVLIAAKPGLFMFDGVMRRPELSWKVAAIWKRINFAAFYRVQVAHDPWNHLIYLAVPLDSATDPNVLLIADYSDGRDPMDIRWSKRQLPFSPMCVGMAFFGGWSSLANGTYTLKIGTNAANILYHVSGNTSDDGVAIQSYYKSAMMTEGGVGVFKQIVVAAKGTGPIGLSVGSIDDVQTQTLQAVVPVANAGKELYRGLNFVNEKMSVTISSGTNVGDSMNVRRLDVWGQVQWQVRPQ